MPYTLAQDGDRFEQRYWSAFIRDEFAAYDRVWSAYIVPLTGRPQHLHFKTDAELAAIGRGQHDLCNAQLHYTTLLHLARVWDLRAGGLPDSDSFIEAITRLAAATDVADELLQRAISPEVYDPWDESPEARRRWRKAHGYPLQQVRDYRNRLLHGRIPPVVEVEHHGPLPGELLYVPSSSPRRFLAVPSIGRERRYLDWRHVVGQPNPNITALVLSTDFGSTENVVREAWNDVLAYLQLSWTEALVPALTT